ncbi:MAG: hypothetical protein LW834_06545 [Cyanobium sp. 49614_E6]|jgi:hypothetical protein|nr:hypothetical protein [Cyanobium sp. 49614_E6]
MPSIHLDIDSSGISKAQAWLAGVQNQMPFAASRALNEVAKGAAKDLNRSTTQYFDRPTQFTQRAYRVSRFSNKRDLTAELAPQQIQERYLLPSIQGGVRPQRPSERRLTAAPAWRPGRGAKLNASGNMSRAAAVKALKGGPDIFTIDKRKGKLRPGVYRRIGSGKMRRYRVESLLLFNQLPNIPKRWPIQKITQDSVRGTWGPALQRYVTEALRTAR